MTRAPLIIIGAGGFGREVVNIVGAINEVRATWDLLGVADDSPSELSLRALARSGTRHLGDVEATMTESTHADLSLVVAIGDPRLRQRVVGMIEHWGSFPVLIHPDATVGDCVDLSVGCIVAPGARLSTSIRLADHVHVDQNVTVGHDTVVERYARLNPQSCISGEVRLGQGVLIGANATVLPRVSVGERSVVGAGAVVVRDVPADSTVKGVPAS